MQLDKIPRRWLRLAVVVLVVLAIAIIAVAIPLSKRAVTAAPPQPIPFSHQRHNEAGLQCLFCHPNPMRSDIAGIPSVEKCMGCHRNIATERPAIQDLTGYWEREEPIPWQPVSLQPDFVFFSHQPHLGSGINCETCHGQVGDMTVAKPVIVMDMGWCLDCHLDQPEEKIARLTDCLTCH